MSHICDISVLRVNGIVSKKDLHLSLTAKAVLQELVFEQFEEATKHVQGDTYASACVALPCFIGLQKHIETTSIRSALTKPSTHSQRKPHGKTQCNQIRFNFHHSNCPGSRN